MKYQQQKHKNLKLHELESLFLETPQLLFILGRKEVGGLLVIILQF
jgi:hypothetical protein